MAKPNGRGGWDITDAEAAEIAAVSFEGKAPTDSPAYNPDHPDRDRFVIDTILDGREEPDAHEVLVLKNEVRRLREVIASHQCRCACGRGDRSGDCSQVKLHGDGTVTGWVGGL